MIPMTMESSESWFLSETLASYLSPSRQTARMKVQSSLSGLSCLVSWKPSILRCHLISTTEIILRFWSCSIKRSTAVCLFQEEAPPSRSESGELGRLGPEGQCLGSLLEVDACRQENETSWSNLGQIQAVQGLLQDLYHFRTPQGEQISPSDVMIISPYRAQRSLVAATFAETEHGCLYRDNLTVDASQGQEAPIVIVLLTKPSEVAEEVSFVANKERLNVALSRAQKAIIVVGNARLWSEPVIKYIERRSNHKFFPGVLRLITPSPTSKFTIPSY